MLDARDQMVFGAMNTVVQTAKLADEAATKSSESVNVEISAESAITHDSVVETLKSKAESVPELSVEKVPEKPKSIERNLTEKTKLNSSPSEVIDSLSVEDIYEKLLKSEEYIPMVKDIESMLDSELDLAFRYKLISEALTPDRFLFVWLLGAKNIPRSFKEQFMIKAKNFDKGYKHVLDNVRKSANGNGVHHSTLMAKFYEFLERDEAMYEAKKAKEEADRNAKAAEKAKKAKEKSKKSKTSKKESKPATATAEKPTKEKAAAKKASAPKAATDESVMSLFNMM